MIKCKINLIESGKNNFLIKAFNYAIALTGGIASGKSTVSKIFIDLGFEIIDADKIAHEILQREYLTIAKFFGHSVIQDKKVNRKALGAIIFDDKDKRKVLEDLLHPLIYEEIVIKSKALDKKKSCYFVDIPLFFENKRYAIKKVLVVSISKDLQLERLMQRDNSSKEEAQKRINSQLPLSQKVQSADYVIENTATLRDLEEKCIMMKAEIFKDLKHYD
ncbi:Dephospho-CoA kinase [hydrothermal vent metagenome]|uniref:Dephospho-CoA kinase n=1 Tax=hydrothermal vent metagenome TaxID=652676 RepID=A0A1W1CYY3_9ZZZZ